MRVGTWNLDGNWTPAHRSFMADQMCDVWLLTEVPELIELQGYTRHLSRENMLQGKRWAGVLSLDSLPVKPVRDPHPASAAAVVGTTTFVSSILPWRSCGSEHPWVGGTTAEKTRATLEVLLAHLPRQHLVWGGDWNHSLTGSETAGSKDGRAMILAALEELQLWSPTMDLDHRLPGVKSIDHVAVSRDLTIARDKAWSVTAVLHDGTELSDHDAYVVDIDQQH